MNQCVPEKIMYDINGPTVAGRPLGYFLTGQANPTDAAAIRLDAHLASIKALLARLDGLVMPEHLSAVSGLMLEAREFRAQVALIGQVKAGKTMLTNALAGMPGMLPSDVNPWTSVVTSIHINTPKPSGATAVFQFYTADEWSGLTESGGRLGELSQRADFETEKEELRRQVTEMQRRTQQRLGSNFGLLLGAQHRFNGFSTELLEKYVCLGEETTPGEAGGRYADVTKSAELYIDDAAFGLPMQVSDTPGVNDPFLARERATLDTLTQSDICVIVLSAHQAFSVVDLALMRILLAQQSEQVILFVNRIDELENPDEQIREIDGFVRDVLKDKGVTGNLPIIYGSAAWAELALTGSADNLPDRASDTLTGLAQARVKRASQSPVADGLLLGQPPYSLNKVRDLSGLHELMAMISHRSIMNVGVPFAADLLIRGAEVSNQSLLLLSQVVDGEMPLKADLNLVGMIARLTQLRHELQDEFAGLSDRITEQMLLQMSTAFREFIDEGTDQLRDLINGGGRVSDWTPNTEVLRAKLNVSFRSVIASASAEISSLNQMTSQAVAAVYSEILENQSQLFAVRTPRSIEPKPPASLMRTMTIDLKTSWIGNWLVKATGSAPVVRRFTDIVVADMREVLDEIRNEHIAGYLDSSREVLDRFLTDHIDTLHQLALLEGPERSSQARQKLGVEIEVKRRIVSLKGLLSELNAQIEALSTDFGSVLK